MLVEQKKALSNGRLLQSIAAVMTGVILGIATYKSSPLTMFLLITATALVLLVLRRPEIGLLSLVTITSSIIYEGWLPLVPLPGGLHLHVSDLVLLGLLAILVMRLLAEREFRYVHTPLDAPLFVFLAIGVVATILGMQNATEQLVLREIWSISYYLALIIVTNLLRTEDQLRNLLRGLFAIAMTVVVTMVAQFVLGDSLRLLPGRVETLSTGQVLYAGISRILPPGESIVFVTFITLTVRLVLNRFTPNRLFEFVACAMAAVAVMLTFNRNFFGGALICFSLLMLLSPARDRRRMLVWGLIAAICIVMVILPAVSVDNWPVLRLLQATWDRFLTLGSEGTLEESSVQQRAVEISYALPQIRSHPILGLGWGASYRPIDARLNWGEWAGRTYIHNGHLYILLKSGIAGYLAWVWLVVSFVRRGLVYWRGIPNVEDRAIVLGFTLTFIGLLAAAFTAPVFTGAYFTPLHGLMMGINESILRRYQVQDRRKQGWE